MCTRERTDIIGTKRCGGIRMNKAKKEIFDNIEKWAKKFYGNNWYSDEALGDIKGLRKIIQRPLNTRYTEEVKK